MNGASLTRGQCAVAGPLRGYDGLPAGHPHGQIVLVIGRDPGRAQNGPDVQAQRQQHARQAHQLQRRQRRHPRLLCYAHGWRHVKLGIPWALKRKRKWRRRTSVFCGESCAFVPPPVPRAVGYRTGNSGHSASRARTQSVENRTDYHWNNTMLLFLQQPMLLMLPLRLWVLVLTNWSEHFQTRAGWNLQ